LVGNAIFIAYKIIFEKNKFNYSFVYLQGVWNMFYFGLYHNLKAICVKVDPNGQQRVGPNPFGHPNNIVIIFA